MEGLLHQSGMLARRRNRYRIGVAGRTYFSAAIFLAGAGLFIGDAQVRQVTGPSPIWQIPVSATGNPARGESIAKANCASCHGTDGNSIGTQYPKLAGQDAAYLYWQLWSYRRGTRSSEVMSAVITALSDADMADAASFYSLQFRKPDITNDQPTAAIGEGLFFVGMPSCAMCHGARDRAVMPMMGMMGGGNPETNIIPRIDGQHAAYIVDQLNRFSNGSRQGGVMNQIAATLTEENRRAIAEFLSSIP